MRRFTCPADRYQLLFQTEKPGYQPGFPTTLAFSGYKSLKSWFSSLFYQYLSPLFPNDTYNIKNN